MKIIISPTSIILFVFFCIGITGCASKGSYTPTGEQIVNFDQKFRNGQMRLTCGIACSGAYGSGRRERKNLHDNELWNDLAISVAKSGWLIDQAYYYLGRSAEGLGYFEAAKTYYKLALSANLKCGGFINTCDGLVFPNDINSRLNNLPVNSYVDKNKINVKPVTANTSEFNAKTTANETSSNEGSVNSTLADNEAATTLSDKQTANDAKAYNVDADKMNINSGSGGKDKSSAEVSLEQDTSVNEGKNTYKTPISFESIAQLLADINEMSNSALKIGPFETKEEFNNRVKDFSKKFSEKAYKIQLPIENAENKKNEIAHYNAETNILTVSLPQAEKRLIWINEKGKRSLKWLNSSYIILETSNIDTSSYEAGNRLGAKVAISKLRRSTNGIFVLTTASKSYSDDRTQKFDVLIDRDIAKKILVKGKVDLELKIDSQYLEDDETPLLISDKNEIEPTFDNPIDLVDLKFGLPVRLLSLTLLDSDGSIIFKEKGRQIQTIPIKE